MEYLTPGLFIRFNSKAEYRLQFRYFLEDYGHR